MITFTGVTFAYDKSYGEVLHNISFSIKSGEFVAIVGKNGAGKTTLIKHINGLLKPSKGEVIINNENIKRKKISQLASIIGLAFQNPDHQLFAETVRKELAFGPKNMRMQKEKIDKIVNDIAKLFNISHLLDRNPLELSGGEKRLVTIASTLTMNQEILCLDEPTFGQDYIQKKNIGNFLTNLTQQGKTVIIVSHDIDFIIDYATRVIVLVDGQIIADGATIEILSDKKLIEEADLDFPILLDLVQQLKKIKDDFPFTLNESSINENILSFFIKKREEFK